LNVGTTVDVVCGKNRSKKAAKNKRDGLNGILLNPQSPAPTKSTNQQHQPAAPTSISSINTVPLG
jgi:hypothetical protein